MPQPVTQIHTETQGIGLSNSPSGVKAILTRVSGLTSKSKSPCGLNVAQEFQTKLRAYLYC